MKKVTEFLQELETLSNKYGIAIQPAPFRNIEEFDPKKLTANYFYSKRNEHIGLDYTSKKVTN